MPSWATLSITKQRKQLVVFNKKIRSVQGAKKFMQDLLLHGHLFHLDDDPAGAGFTEMQAYFIRRRQAEIFSFNSQEWGSFKCPHGYCVYLLGLHS